ncbi:hypothetical protein GQ53DRAFT_756611 [Thozetella sp. PMI_491]|nr:hypothetical protein GQ53DRAFT_756611 [Thozetella sp. PMI_491]
MPATTHPPAVSLPAIKDADVPFSSLFDANFDLATVEATAQLADKSIFVTSTGRRFLLESIPNAQEQHQNVSPPSQALPHQLHPPTASLPPLNNHQQQYHPANLQSPVDRQPIPRPIPGVAAAFPPSAPLPVHGSPTTGWGYHATTQMPTQDAVFKMDHSGTNRFGAMPLYGESDGGYLAAETLTDHRGNRTLVSPGAASPVASYPPAPSSPRAYQTPDTSPQPVFSSRFADFDYPSYMAQAQAAPPRAPASPTGALPSLMEFSTPVDTYVQPNPPAVSPFSPASPYDEYLYSQTSQLSPSPSASQAAALHVPQVHVNGYPQPSASPQYSTSSWTLGRSISNVEFSGEIDTQTPVVVLPPTPLNTHGSSSDGGSVNRDNVLPGEDVLFDGLVKSSTTLTSPNFMDGQLKVFRNTITNDLRFHCRVGYDSETYWMKAANAQLVPVYAYDNRFSCVIYIRDDDNYNGKNSSYAQQNLQNSARPSGIYQFPRLADLCAFQAKLTGDRVVLDITSVRLIRVSKLNSRSYETYSSVRVQIWHEMEPRRSGQSDTASFVTAGTALSGPHRERLVPQSSKLMVYLGRLSEYITTFITDDIDVKADGPTMVKLKIRKAGTFSRRGSRWPGLKARHVPKQGSEPAGLDCRGQAANADVEASYELYKTFEIDFESSPSQDNFLRKWDEVIKERRAQRMRLDQIQEDMEQVTFSGRKAREIW